MRLSKGYLISNRYQIEERIGSGGMAIVYKATDMKLDRIVTLKIMREEHIEDRKFIQRFNVEARAAAKLNHPNIVKIYDVGRHKDIYYIVMEYIDGVTLKDLIMARGMFTQEEVLGVAIQITSALGHAHENQIIHRDVKPQNILVNVDGEVKVADFGIATTITAKTAKLEENTVGSVHYFSPEQARGSKLDEKSDIYSIAITMYEMTCGEVPFDGDTVVEIVLKHVNEEMPNIRGINNLVSEDVIKTIYKAGAKDKNDRFKNAHEMNEELKKSLTEISGERYTNPQDFSKTSTLNLTEKDIRMIKEDALKAFYNDEDGDDMGYEYEEDDDKKNKVVKVSVLSGVLLSIIIIMLAFNKFKTEVREVVEVPNIVGLNYEEALKIIYENDLELKKVEERYSDTEAKGVILEQNYIEGDTAYVGDEVEVAVSRGTDKIKVPNVEGMDIISGLKEFKKLPFEIKEVYVYDNLANKNTIVEQSPKGGDKAIVASEIVLFISKGKENRVVKVPNLIGITRNEAIASLGNRNLEIGTITETFSETIDEGVIISQGIVEGNEVAEKTRVSITISKGTKEETKPEETKPEETKPEETKPEETKPEETKPEEIEEEKKGKELRIETLFLSNGVRKAKVQILKISKSVPKVIYEKEVSVTELPLIISVSGEGTVEYQLYVDTGNGYVHSASNYVNFDEVN